MRESEKVDMILYTCEKITGITMEQLRSKSRKREIKDVRHMAATLSSEYTNLTLKEIGQLMGKRDHSTIHNSLDTCKDLRDSEKKFNKVFLKIEEVIKEAVKPDPNQRYFDIVDSAIEAFVNDLLIPKQSDHCFIGSYVFYKTGIRNTGWYHILMEGKDESITKVDIKCFNAISYNNEEKRVLLHTFDQAQDVLSGLLLACEAAYHMEDWTGVYHKFNLIDLIQDKDLIKEFVSK